MEKIIQEFDGFVYDPEVDTKPPLTLEDLDTSHINEEQKEECPFQKQRERIKKRREEVEKEWSMNSTLKIK